MKMIINGKDYDIEHRANLRGADLSYANLHGAILSCANLRGADLSYADLRHVDLSCANLRGADLCGANLCGANLCGANLCGANLRGADLCGANLCGADLRDANLCGADLRDANLCDANLRDADLRDANLRGASLRDALNLSAILLAQTTIIAEGDIIGYKKLKDNSICKLRIPIDAKRSSATGRKCRAEFAIVLEGEGVSKYDPSFAYKVGETVRPTEPFNNDRWNECASGIHFYLTRPEAEAH